MRENSARWRAAVAASWIGLTLAGAVAGAQAPGRPLGQLIATAPPGTLLLRVGVEKVGGERATAVPLDHVFQSGDHLRLTLRSSRAGYLRVLHDGADGRSEPLWPAGEAAAPIGAEEVVLVPGTGSIRLDDKAGVERLRVV